MNYGAT